MMKKLAQFDGVELPVTAESAARAVALGDELRVLVNVAEAGHTEQILMTGEHELRMLAPLPLTMASACAHKDGLIVTGSSSTGEPLIASVARNGAVSWLTRLEGPLPLRWPIPGCGASPRIAWQIEHGRIETATIGAAAGIAAHTSFQAGGPPLDVAVSADVAWAVWADNGGVWLAQSNGMAMRKLGAHYCSEVAIDASNREVWAAWMNENEIRWARIDQGTLHAAKAPVSGSGRPGIVAGPEAVVVMRYSEIEEEREPQWKTELFLRECETWSVNELIHSVAWWGERIVAVGRERVRLLRVIQGAQRDEA